VRRALPAEYAEGLDARKQFHLLIGCALVPLGLGGLDDLATVVIDGDKQIPVPPRRGAGSDEPSVNTLIARSSRFMILPPP
jgi:hypothetical protein